MWLTHCPFFRGNIRELSQFFVEEKNNKATFKIKPNKDQAVILVNENRFDFWDIESRTKKRTIQAKTVDRIQSFVVTPGLDRIYSGALRGAIKSWPLESGSSDSTIRLEGGRLFDLKLSKDGNELFSVSIDEMIRVWDSKTFNLHRTIKLDNFVPLRLKPSDDGNFLAVIGDGVKFLDLKTGKDLMTFKGHFKGIDSVAISPNSEILATGSKDFSLKLWNIADGSQIHTLSNPFTSYNLSFTTDGKSLISHSAENIDIWEVSTGRKTLTLNRHLWSVGYFATFKDGKRLYSSAADQTIRIWDLETGAQLKNYEIGSGITTAILSDDEKTFAVLGSLGGIKFFDAETGEKMATIHEVVGYSDRIVQTKDGNTIFVSNYDDQIMTWDLSAKGLRTKLCRLAKPMIDSAICD